MTRSDKTGKTLTIFRSWTSHLAPHRDLFAVYVSPHPQSIFPLGSFLQSHYTGSRLKKGCMDGGTVGNSRCSARCLPLLLALFQQAAGSSRHISRGER